MRTEKYKIEGRFICAKCCHTEDRRLSVTQDELAGMMYHDIGITPCAKCGDTLVALTGVCVLDEVDTVTAAMAINLEEGIWYELPVSVPEYN